MPISSTTHNSQKTSKHSSQRHSAQIIVFVQSQKLDEAIKNALITNTISRNPNPFQEWVIKAIQLQETCEVRHSAMILSSGKSSIRNTLILAYSDTRCKHTFTRMNPKTITASPMFDTLVPSLNDWRDGIFSVLWRIANNTQHTALFR